MSMVNGAYTCFQGRKVERGAQISILPASQKPCDKVNRWLKWGVSLPVTIAHSLYNTALMIRHQEFLKPIKANIYQGSAVHHMPFPYDQTTYHVITSPQIMHELGAHHRTDAEGLFTDIMNTQVFFPAVKDVCADPDVPLDDFLFTCSAGKVASYRAPLLQFMGSAQIASLKPQMDEVVDETLAWLQGKERDGIITMDAAGFTGTYTIAVLSRLFLGHPGPFEEYEKIGKAVQFSLNFLLIRKWSKPTAEQVKKYGESIEVIKEAIASSKGPFVDSLKEAGMSLHQIKSTLFVTYIGGSETSASLLKYLLWKVGQEKQYQDEVVREVYQSPESSYAELASRIKIIDGLFSESIRMFTPAYTVGRFANQDIEITVRNRDSRWTCFIPKGDGVLYCPSLAARDPQIYDRPDAFDPHRSKPSPALNHKPFNEGKHACPGQWLAKMDITTLATALIARYEISSSPEKADLNVKAYVTLTSEDVQLILKRRAPDGIVASR